MISFNTKITFSKTILVSTILMISVFACSKTEPEKSTEPTAPTAAIIVENMASGFNLGNTYDNGQQNTNAEEIYPLIDFYAEAGMEHIRIPITWLQGFGGDALADENGNVNFEHPRFLEAKKVIDYSLDKGLYVVINAHHERSFKEHYDGSEEYNQLFTTLWTDIATYFENYPPELIFELLNEPEGAFGDNHGEISTTDPIGLERTRQMNAVGHAAVRATGGNNATRIIMISTNGQGNHTTIEEVFPSKETLPGKGTDKYLAIQVHTYDPWSFAGQDGNNENYPGDDFVEQSLRNVAAHGRMLGVPINYGEYGVGRNGNQESRDTELVRGFYRTIVQTALDEKMSTSVWDDRGWFGTVRKNNAGDYEFTYNIVPAMLASE